MEYTQLGRAGVKVSRIVLGTMNFGPETEEGDAHEIMDRALELGVNFFDTADVYGRTRKGWTEEIIGRWFASRPEARDQVVLATKVYGNVADGPNDRGLSAYHIRAQIEASLRRLQTDRIDLYQFHHIDRTVPWEEIWQAIDVLVAQGKVVYSGSSNFPGWGIARANERAERRGSFGLVSEQSIYSLLNRNIELEVIPAAQQYGLGVIPWSPLAGGLLGGVLGEQAATGRRSGEHFAARVEEHRPQLEQYEAFAAKKGVAPAVLGLAWVLHQPGVTGPIIGPRTMSQLEDAVAALDVELDEADLKTLDEIFPGPGGAAPEAYSW
ncbi:aldo/keto reductase [Glycomyces harbinensis]|uniref:Predicted oxidoreductase n=1 Tax=Glycomyces harbinensis TaxID=58114 RepID=A0A1G6QY54_9ACTN|nr:aldo/keto reductase [Glycomyces harbinensis]SDC96725.1 Predicted oxidoreductase [Glycomyces harbinensis]